MSVYNIHLLSFSHFCYIFYDFILFLDESNRFTSRSLNPLVNANSMLIRDTLIGQIN